MIASWAKDTDCMVHNHGLAVGIIFVLAGDFVEKTYAWSDRPFNRQLAVEDEQKKAAGQRIDSAPGNMHAMRCTSDRGITLHFYSPPSETIKLLDLDAPKTYVVGNDHGTWLPDPEDIIREKSWSVGTQKSWCDIIVYTTEYQGGGLKFQKAARTKKSALEAHKKTVVCRAVNSKKEFLAVFHKVGQRNLTVRDFHFYGHSGMYGIMFGTTQWPEQFSPFEWKHMQLPVTHDSNFYFRACRSGSVQTSDEASSSDNKTV